jgi:hypothetical protein
VDGGQWTVDSGQWTKQHKDFQHFHCPPTTVHQPQQHKDFPAFSLAIGHCPLATTTPQFSLSLQQYSNLQMEVLELLSVVGMSSLKVLPGVGLALLYELTALEIFLTIFIGGMAGIITFSFFGTRIRAWRKKRRMARNIVKKVKIKRARRIVRIWRKYGLVGVAFLTPPLISPPFGVAIAVAFGERMERILLYMGISMAFWAAVFAIVGEQILALIK